VLALWGTWPPNEKVPFKLQGASCTDGQLATALTYIHQPYNINSTLFSTNATLYVGGLIGKIPIKFLLDSGASMSVVCHKFIANHHTQITEAETVAVGANGAPLDVIGLTTLTVSLESFTTQQNCPTVNS